MYSFNANTVNDYDLNSSFNGLYVNYNNVLNGFLGIPDFNQDIDMHFGGQPLEIPPFDLAFLSECSTLPQSVPDLIAELTPALSPLTSDGSSTLVSIDSGSSWNDQSTLDTGFWSFGNSQHTRIPGDADAGTATASDAMSVSYVDITALQVSPPTPPSPIKIQKKSKTTRRRQYLCDECPRVFDRICNLKNHKLTHDPNHPRPHECPVLYCPKAFSRKHDLYRHLQTLKHRDDPHALKALANRNITN